jgi:hypothetical protein
MGEIDLYGLEWNWNCKHNFNISFYGKDILNFKQLINYILHIYLSLYVTAFQNKLEAVHTWLEKLLNS